MTKKEMFAKLHNEYLERVCRWEVDVAYFTARSKHFKKKSPEHAQALAQINEKKAGLFWDNMLLKVTELLIDAYANSNKKATEGAESKA